MRKLIVVLMLLPVSALAHPSLVPHEHPHGPSLLPDLVSMAIAAIVVGGIWFAANRLWRR